MRNTRDDLRMERPLEENHQREKSRGKNGERANLYRQILQKETETSPFRSLANRRERADKVRRLIEKHA
jgi:hypothetical protein